MELGGGGGGGGNIFACPPLEVKAPSRSYTHRFPPQPVPRPRVRDVGGMQQPPGQLVQQNLASENAHLRDKISQLEHKLRDIETKAQEKDKEGR